MTETTINQLITLRDNGQLTPEETYKFDIDNIKYYMKAKTVNTFYPETTDERGYVLHFLIDTQTIDYMKDTTNNIEGYFDWSGNVSGTCSHIYFEKSDQLFVTNSSYVYCEDEASGTINRCSDITLGDGSVVTLSNSHSIDVGANSKLTTTECKNITVGENNILTFQNIDGLSVGDGNTDVGVTNNVNIVGGNNNSITVNGNSNIVAAGTVELDIEGDCNTVTKSKYVGVSGSFNYIDKTTLATLTAAVGNKVRKSNFIDITNTNNNELAVDNLEIKNKDPFLQYVSAGGVKRVKNMVENVNMQSDCEATVLIVDDQKLRGSDTKSAKKYKIVDGVWTEI